MQRKCYNDYITKPAMHLTRSKASLISTKIKTCTSSAPHNGKACNT